MRSLLNFILENNNQKLDKLFTSKESEKIVWDFVSKLSLGSKTEFKRQRKEKGDETLYIKKIEPTQYADNSDALREEIRVVTWKDNSVSISSEEVHNRGGEIRIQSVNNNYDRRKYYHINCITVEKYLNDSKFFNAGDILILFDYDKNTVGYRKFKQKCDKIAKEYIAFLLDNGFKFCYQDERLAEFGYKENDKNSLILRISNSDK